MEKTCEGALLTGQVSRSQKTVQAHRLLRDGRATEEEFRNAVESDEREILSAQKNFAFVSGGQVGWLDLLRPIASSFTGFAKKQSNDEDAVGPVTRWFRTNTFYRKPLVEGKIESKGKELLNKLPVVEGGVVFFLGPYSFVRLVENTFYKEKEELARDYCAALAKNAFELRGYACVLLLEPAVGYDIPRNALQNISVKEALAEFKGLKLGVHFPLAKAENAISLVEDAALDFIGIDCTCTSKPENVCTSKNLLLGVVDGARVAVEEKESVKRLVEWFAEKSEFSGNYYIGPTDRLYDVPFEIALQKVRLLSELAGEQKCS